MSGIGRLGGAALRGVYEGRDWLKSDQERDEDREWLDNRRQRTTRREGYLDPAEEEMTGIRMSGARRDEGFSEFSDPYRRRGVDRDDYSAERAVDDQDFARPFQRNAIRRGDTMGRMDVDDREYNTPFKRRANDRGDEMGERENEFGRFSDPYRREAAARENEMGVFARDDARDMREVMEGDMGNYRQAQEGQEYLTNANNAIGNFASTGNPTALEDFYNNMYPDDGQIEIKKLENGEYEMIHSSGKTTVTTRDELLRSSKESFMQHPSVSNSMYGGRGLNRPGMSMSGASGGSYSRGGIGAGRAFGGRGSSGKDSAYLQEVYSRAETYMAQGMNQIEAMAEAHAQASYKSQVSPQDARMAFFQDMVKQFMPAPEMQQMMSDEELSAAAAKAQAQAQELTQNFTEMYLNGYNGGGSGNAHQGHQQGTSPNPGEDVEGESDYLDDLINSQL